MKEIENNQKSGYKLPSFEHVSADVLKRDICG